MRISDWSSDVCSSDLLEQPHLAGPAPLRGPRPARGVALVAAADAALRVLIPDPSRSRKDGRGDPAVFLSIPRQAIPYTAAMDDAALPVAATPKLPTVHARIFPSATIGSAPCRERVCQQVSDSVV